MREDFLHFIWQHLYFSQENLQTLAGESLKILDTGKYNPNEGADFENAIVAFNGKHRKGYVEMHLKTSDWLKHGHNQNAKYENVILHIVWENDLKELQQVPLPTLELKNRVNPTLLHNYRQLLANKNFIPCENLFAEVENIFVLSTWDKMLVQRLERKSEKVKQIWQETRQDWEETTYRLLTESFGFKINAEPCAKLARQTPLKIFLKHQNSLLQIEALLFGQAGFLSENLENEYAQNLQREYQFLQHKYNLVPLQVSEWNFLRLRPANFPTIRLAQLAQILFQNVNLFSVLLYAEKFETLQKIFSVNVSDYWQKHYHFGKTTEKTASKLGKSSFQSLLINAIVPLLVFYSKSYQKPEYLDKAISFLEQLPAESNHIIEKWQKIGAEPQSAADTQALLELFHTHCQLKKCLQCGIGIELLRKNYTKS
ncbi:DUF2851 family protein [Raineya orbicola]|jgi:hypothetical protein|uniref:DUF2851 domain-containing protein n=1 Tax=Raineya orbicola TaxID=2016530 RepID=A0A2N3IJR1_9BACT|nr:DUF2851 family protein [Raineya orbicola]PKQ70572.1 hypothetical protein Rain11_0302 [Raineya orbicola]